jgi:F0F1-type ATP synthase assembly protein I
VPEQRDDKLSATAQATRFLGVGLTWVGSTVLFLFLGSWADGRLGTKPWLSLLGAVVGAAAGFYNLIRQVAAATPRKTDRQE